MQNACERVTCEEAQPRGITSMSGSSPSRSEAPGAQQGGGRLLCESVERRPIRVEHRINQYRIGVEVDPHVTKDELAITANGDALVIQEHELHRAVRVLLLVASFEDAEGLSARLQQR